MLRQHGDVEILEKGSEIGGIAKARMLDGIPYHLVGGHCFNSKSPEVLDFVFSALSLNEWNKVKRNAKIEFKNHRINYPIEFSVKQIFAFDPDLAQRITADFLSAVDNNSANLADWFRGKFGNTLAEEYLIPYNRKIWGMEPCNMDPAWVMGKLPLPNVKQFFASLFQNAEDSMVHSSFYYPKSNSQNSLLFALANGSHVELDYNVERIEKKDSKWIVNGERSYDLLISTIPLDVLPKIIQNTPKEILDFTSQLKWNSISNALWETTPNDETWTYYPDPQTIFHRHIHIGNFLQPARGCSITETLGRVDRDIIEKEGQKTGYLLNLIDHNISERAYVVYDKNYQVAVPRIKQWLYDSGLHTLGRFGEWEYYNMDACIESAIKLYKQLMPSLGK